MAIVNTIPDRYKNGFREIVKIKKTDFENVKRALPSTNPVLTLKELVEQITEINKQEYSNLYNILKSAGSLTPFIEDNNIEELIVDITNISLREKIIKEEDKQIFEERLLFLLREKNIFYAGRGQILATEKSNVFISARIITDFRPIFGLQINELPECGMIIHDLHLHYRGDSEDNHKDIFLALDRNDIKILKETLIRAEKKEENLRDVFKNSKTIKIIG